MQLKWLPLIFFLSILITLEGVTWGQCVADGNDTANTATPIGYGQVVTGVVCPDIDPFDYYTCTIPDQAYVEGTVTLDSPQTGTTMKISGPSGELFNSGTTDSTHSLVLTIPSNSVPAGVYYIRIGFYSAYAFDHDYTLSVSLKVSLPPPPEQPWEPGYYDIPWPLERGDVRNTGGSVYPGPGKNLHVSRTIDLYTIDEQLGTLKSTVIGDECRKLRVGRSDWLFFINWNGKRTHLKDGVKTYKGNHLYAYNLSSGEVWHKITYDPEICLNIGGIQHFDKVTMCNFLWKKILYQCSEDNTINSFLHLEEYEANPLLPPSKLLTVGRHIYVSSGIEFGGDEDFHNFMIYDEYLDWYMGGLIADKEVRYVAEDASANAFVRWSDESFEKYLPTGKPGWFTYETRSDTGGVSGPAYFMWPIIGNDNWIWVASSYKDESSSESVTPFGSRFQVFQDFETSEVIRKSGDYGLDKTVVKACYSRDSRLYVAFYDSTIACYKNWDEKVWEKNLGKFEISGLNAIKQKVAVRGDAAAEGQDTSEGDTDGSGDNFWGIPELGELALVGAPDGGHIAEMIIDRDNIIYVLRTFGQHEKRRCVLYVLNPDTGEVEKQLPLEVPGELGSGNCLAIGTYHRLYWMNSAGWLQVLNPLLVKLEKIPKTMSK